MILQEIFVILYNGMLYNLLNSKSILQVEIVFCQDCIYHNVWQLSEIYLFRKFIFDLQGEILFLDFAARKTMHNFGVA